ncbi:MAG: hypothetical protein FJ134_12370 [Deltaproteobacteria bacterium]|nr:hypothetical protein [Deltaproteobacteria bacterium]
MLEKKQPGTLDLGDEVSALITPWPKDDEQVARLVVRDGNKEVASVQDYLFTTCFRLEAGPARYWIIEGWNGAAHGGYRHHYFCRRIAGEPMRFLGTIKVGDRRTEATFSQENIRCRNSQPFVRYDDDRFAYFETSFAQSSAMFFPKFYRLTPKGLVLDNRAFPAEYRREIARIEAEIRSTAAQMPTKPERIGSGTDLDVWLLARTIHYLVLREDKQAWESLELDVARYFKTKKGLGEWQRKIRSKMSEAPY